MLKLIFSSDIHGSTVVWRKFLKLLSEKKDYLFILGGDLSGKYFAQISEIKGKFVVEIMIPEKQSYSFKNENKLQKFLEEFKMMGGYWTEKSALKNNLYNFQELNELFLKKKKLRIKKWLKELTSQIKRNNKVLITRGNDDPVDFLEIQNVKTDLLILDSEILEIENFLIFSFPFVTPTPWETPGELTEEDIEYKLNEKLKKIDKSKKMIFNFHCPPYNTNLDIGPVIYDNFSLKLGIGGTDTEHVGSRSIRKIIKKYNPVISLHGHIHESQGKECINSTLCFNPGSEYANGILKYFDIRIIGEKVIYEHFEL